FTDGDAPLGAEQPDAIGEMPGSGEQSNEIERQLPGDYQLALDFAKGGAGMRVQVDAGKAQMPDVPADVGEGDDAGPALQGVHPVALPRIGGEIRFAAPPDIETEQGVEQDRQPNAEGFEEEHKRERPEELDLI